MTVIYQEERNRIITLNKEGNIQSIKPLMVDDKYSKFYVLVDRIKKLSEEFPTEKFYANLMNVPEIDYNKIKDDVGIGDEFIDHIDKFYFNVSRNGTVIAHKEF